MFHPIAIGVIKGIVWTSDALGASVSSAVQKIRSRKKR